MVMSESTGHKVEAEIYRLSYHEERDIEDAARLERDSKRAELAYKEKKAISRKLQIYVAKIVCTSAIGMYLFTTYMKWDKTWLNDIAHWQAGDRVGLLAALILSFGIGLGGRIAWASIVHKVHEVQERERRRNY